MKSLITALIFLFSFLISSAQNAGTCKQGGASFSVSQPPSLLADTARSDTVNVLKTIINLQITDFTNKKIAGNSLVKFTPKISGLNTISLDLLKLTIDSVEINNVNLTYSYNDTVLVSHLGAVKNIGDTISLTVFYHGTPQVDPQWGGLSFSSLEAFNLGVGFAANPHVYGRVWFPCFDNFVERCSFEFNIKTNGGKLAYCNGLLKKDTTDVGGYRTRTWKLDEEIPSYLACVAVGAYAQLNDKYVSISGDTIPVVISDFATDTTKVKNSFIHLKNAFNCYEAAYGPYLWPKVGYVIVPNGAMEHPTAISYPRSLIAGNTTNEDIMAHELSHHWWGDQATCHSQEDMWINEGMATFSQYYFFECTYGPATYKSKVRANHENMIHYVHKKEGGFLAISGIPHSLTYGEHVYNKGADVAHTMRGYLGDSLFFVGLRSVMANNKFTDITSAQFRDDMTAATGVNMTDFFKGWVFNGGWPHFSIDSFETVVNVPNYNVTLHLKQKLDGAPAYLNNVPLEVTFKDAQWNEVVRKINVSGPVSTATVSIPIDPAFAGLDLNEKISDAVTSDLKTMKAPGTFLSSFSNGRMQIVVQAITPNDSAFVLVEHNWAHPDPFKTANPLYKLSTYHYWKVSGLFPALFDASATVTYDGRNSLSGGGGYLDDDLIKNTNQEDSIVLMYRKNAGDEWVLFPWYTKTNPNPADKYGLMKIDSLLPGEYTIAFAFAPTAVKENESSSAVLIYPNPGSGKFTVSSSKYSSYDLEIYNLLGDLVCRKKISAKQELVDLNEQAGMYFYKVITAEGSSTGRIVIVK